MPRHLLKTVRTVAFSPTRGVGVAVVIVTSELTKFKTGLVEMNWTSPPLHCRLRNKENVLRKPVKYTNNEHITYIWSNFLRIFTLLTSGYATWFTAGGAIRIAHYDLIDDVITRKL